MYSDIRVTHGNRILHFQPHSFLSGVVLSPDVFWSMAGPILASNSLAVLTHATFVTEMVQAVRRTDSMTERWVVKSNSEDGR